MHEIGSDDELFINIIFYIIKIETAIIQESNTDSAQFKFITNLSSIKIINKIANSKAKDYKSLTSKTIFKFMDMVDM